MQACRFATPAPAGVPPEETLYYAHVSSPITILSSLEFRPPTRPVQSSFSLHWQRQITTLLHASRLSLLVACPCFRLRAPSGCNDESAMGPHVVPAAYWHLAGLGRARIGVAYEFVSSVCLYSLRSPYRIVSLQWTDLRPATASRSCSGHLFHLTHKRNRRRRSIHAQSERQPFPLRRRSGLA